MEQKRAYKYRFYPSNDQKRLLAQTFGCSRYVYNWALREKTDAYYQRGIRLYYEALAQQLTILKKEHPWLADVSSVPLQQSLRHLDKAFINFFEGRANYPTFHKKHGPQSATYASNAFTLKGTTLTLANKIIRENQVVCVESLHVKNMVRYHCLAKAISDVGWSEFVRQLEYKACWYGRTLVKIDTFYPSSKRCHACGHILEKLTLDVRSWTCPECGVFHDRDINAAQNVLAAGLAVAACGDRVRPGRAKAQKGNGQRSRKAQ